MTSIINQPKKRLIVVLGMQQSGISVIARGLDALGVEMGNTVVPDRSDCPSVSWEDRDLTELSMELLKHVEHDFCRSSLAPIVDDRYSLEQASVFKLRAIELLRQRTRLFDIFGVKDSQFARLLPFWQEIFQYLELEVGYVIVVRNPLSVARSMKVQNKFEPERTFYLWLDQLVSAVLETSIAPRVFINYDNLLEKPGSELKRIASALALPDNPMREQLIQEYKDEFLSHDLRHSQFAFSDLRLHPSVPRCIVEAFEVLEKAAADQLHSATEEMTRAFIAFKQDLISMRSTLEYMDRLESKVADCTRALCERDESINLLNRSLTERDDRVEDLNESLGDNRKQIDELQRYLSERDRRIDHINQTLADKVGQIDYLQRMLCEQSGLIDSLNQTTIAQNTQIVEHVRTLSIRDDKIKRLNQQLVKQKKRNITLLQTLANREGQIDLLRQQAGEGNAQASVLLAQVSALQLKLDSGPKSMSWPISRALRAGAVFFSRLIARRRNTQDIGTPLTVDPQPIDAYFDREFYLQAYPDVAASGIDPLHHYRQLGRSEGRLGRAPELIGHAGKQVFMRGHPTILVVSHDASRTGAPILAWNLCRKFQDRFNIIVLLLADGDISDYFNENCNFLVGPYSPSIGNEQAVGPIIDELCNRYRIDFAFVNSIESGAVLPGLAARYIPSIFLVHEFFAYSRITAFRLANATVFPARIVQRNALTPHTRPAIEISYVLPQGKCEIPSPELTDLKAIADSQKIVAMLNPEGSKCFVVLGVGTVDYRKGVDLFVATAAEIQRLSPYASIVMLWIGHIPPNQLEYASHLQEQIMIAGIDNVLIIGAVANLEPFYARADALFLSSRLDPMPNVAIDFMSLGKPVICFENATGIAEVLADHPDTIECILPFASIGDAARLIQRLHSSPDYADAVSAGMRDLAIRHFDMSTYATRLLDIAYSAKTRSLQEKNDAMTLRNSPEFNIDFAANQFPYRLTRAYTIMTYLRSSATGIDRRRPAPGFEPAIYVQHHEAELNHADPFAHWLRARCPTGPWQVEVIHPSKNPTRMPEVTLGRALHIHSYYVELLNEIISQLDVNGPMCDLFVSVASEADATYVYKQLGSYRLGTCDVKVVPNRGRDIGPFITAFGPSLQTYDLVGHVHTKQTTHCSDRAFVQRWREYLLLNLLGGEYRSANAILKRFAEDPQLGIVFPDDPNLIDWGKNYELAKALAQQMGIHNLPRIPPSFPVGTMFWARPAALAPLFDLDLDWSDYPDEPLPDIDGSMLHAIERLLPIVVGHTGYRRASVHVPGSAR